MLLIFQTARVLANHSRCVKEESIGPRERSGFRLDQQGYGREDQRRPVGHHETDPDARAMINFSTQLLRNSL